MARHASTYRQARRAAWLKTKPLDTDGTPMDWFSFNYASKEQAKKQGYGSSPTYRLAAQPSQAKDYRGKMGAKDKARMDRSK